MTGTGKKTPGDHTDEPHNHPNPPTHPHDRATTESAADSTAPQPRSRTLPAADSEEAASPQRTRPGRLPLPERLCPRACSKAVGEMKARAADA